MSVECEIAQYVIKKHALMTELNGCRDEIKKLCDREDIELPLAVEIDGVVVTVSKPSYDNASPLTKVIPLHKGCEA